MQFKVGDTIKKYDIYSNTNSSRLGTIIEASKDSYYLVEWLTKVQLLEKETIYSTPLQHMTHATKKGMALYEISLAELFEIKKQLNN